YWPVQASNTWTVENQPLTKSREPQDCTAWTEKAVDSSVASSRRRIIEAPVVEWPSRSSRHAGPLPGKPPPICLRSSSGPAIASRTPYNRFRNARPPENLRLAARDSLPPRGPRDPARLRRAALAPWRAARPPPP